MSALARKKLDVAISEFKMAVEMATTPNPGTMIRLAGAYDQAKQPDESLAVLAKVMATPNLDPAFKGFVDREKAIAEKLKATGAK